MSTLIDKINYLKQTKANIRQSIIDKGVDIPENTKFRDYSSKIASISSGATSDNNAKIVVDSSVTSLGNEGLEQSIETLDVSNWDTSNVTNLKQLFSGCKKLTTLDVSNWDTSKVTDMSYMFNGEWVDGLNLTTLDVSSWDTSKVTNMSYMFDKCQNLTTLDVSNWNTSNVTRMNNMFRYGPDITLDLGNFDTSKVTSMECMFGFGSTLPINISNWDTSNVTNMATMFVYVPKLTSLDLSGWDTSKVTTMNRMFDNSHIENLILGTNWASNSNVKTFDLQNCSALTHDSVLDVFNKLASRTNSPTLRLSSTSKGLMSDEEVAIATNKGWVVS